MNQAILQTLPRTVNTGMGAAFILTALAVLGGSSLTDFALALLIGLVVGTYSSVFTAAQSRSGSTAFPAGSRLAGPDRAHVGPGTGTGRPRPAGS